MYIEIQAEFKQEEDRKKFADMLGYAGFSTSFTGEKVLAIFNGYAHEPVLRQISLATKFELEVMRHDLFQRCLKT